MSIVTSQTTCSLPGTEAWTFFGQPPQNPKTPFPKPFRTICSITARASYGHSLAVQFRVYGLGGAVFVKDFSLYFGMASSLHCWNQGRQSARSWHPGLLGVDSVQNPFFFCLSRQPTMRSTAFSSHRMETVIAIHFMTSPTAPKLAPPQFPLQLRLNWPQLPPSNPT